ncbi:menaquinone biosynthetic enzyme MqnA/MqnD family protein [Thiovibrio frasassiensis]|uniref:Chorismate dehydratase n=1 Tax=Thiovibrio frasassiensis TaxID=2984131 RepID=A0A9X4RMV3_9BACT|nr:menaquinone biosynthesis protein [Thiovibrio frasassiensis]MDG4476588.1 menaquinone biosynthesis protein [Thiovibrio frasassiensis]
MSGSNNRMKITARIGMVNYINTAPLYEVWQQTVHRPDWLVTEAPPSQLNRMLHEKELDLGFVSSQEYALHPGEYRILSDLSISATGQVGSVFLFSEVPFTQLEEQLVLLSSQSQTSVSLVKIILEDFYQVRPRYCAGMATDLAVSRERPMAVLAIGDEALRLAAGERYPHRLDLGEAWQARTGLPFVFAVWAVREDFCRSAPDTVLAIHQELLRCLREGKKRLREISAAVAGRVPMDENACYRYLQGIEYDLGSEKQEALTLFFEYLVSRGEVPATALPIKVCGNH